MSINPWGINQQIGIALLDYAQSKPHKLTFGQANLIDSALGTFDLDYHAERIGKKVKRYAYIELARDYQQGKYYHISFIPLPALHLIAQGENVPVNCTYLFQEAL